MVDPVTRAISCSQQAAPAHSDASKVTAKGPGLSKAYVGQKNSFCVDCSKAGGSLTGLMELMELIQLSVLVLLVLSIQRSAAEDVNVLINRFKL